jgi:general secretion pathway protein D
MACTRIVTWFGAAVVAFALAGCAAQRAYREGNALVAQDHVAAGLAKYQEAVAADPDNALYRAAYLRARDTTTTRLLLQADRELGDGKPGLAVEDYQRVLAIDPGNERARTGLRAVDTDRRHALMLSDAHGAVEKKDYERARAKLDAILTERPTHDAARKLLEQVNENIGSPGAEATLAEAFRKPISLEFRDAPIKQIFEVIARHSGLNILFDKDVKTDQRTSIFLKNSTVDAAVYFLLMTNQLERQIMDGNTILIYPNLPAKQKDYQELTVKTFYLANAEAKNVANTLKTILKSRDVVVDEKLNLLILRDSPDAIRLASQLVALQDVPEPEVVLDVEVLEIKRSRMLELGVAWPTSLTLAPLESAAGGPLTIAQLRRLDSNTVGVSGLSATVKAKKVDGDSNTLAHPSIRVRNKEKAKVVIGDKVPNITTTVSPGTGGFASESVNYTDVGLTLNVEPTVYLNNEVGIRISLEVSNVVDSVITKTGTTTYRIGTRSASTMLQLKDGENQVLAGLLNNEDRTSGTKIPALGSLPIVGRLFGSTTDSNDKTEIVLSITPHLVRNIQRPAASISEFSSGTESSFRRRPDNPMRALTTPTTATARQQGAPQPAVPVAAQPVMLPPQQPVQQMSQPGTASAAPAPIALPPSVPAQLPRTLPPTQQGAAQVTAIEPQPARPQQQ